MGTLNVDVHHDGAWTYNVWSKSGQQHSSGSQPYTQAIVDMSPYEGPLKIRFRGVHATGNYGNMAIDNIAIGEKSFLFTTFEDGSNPNSQTFRVRNKGGGAMDWHIDLADKPDWFLINRTSGSLDPNETETVTVSVNTTGLSGGQYCYSFEIIAPDAQESPQTIQVDLNVIGPILKVSENHFTNTVLQDGNDPNAHLLTIQNTGGGTLNWSLDLTDQPGWLSVSPTSGVLAQDANQVVTLSVDITDLPGNQYSYAFQVIDPVAAGSPQTVRVDLKVMGPILEMSANQVSFWTYDKGPIPDSQMLTVSNVGGGTLNWIADLTDKPDWLIISPFNSSLGHQESEEITLSAAAEELFPGQYGYSFAISDPAAQNSPQEISVYLSISAFSGGDGSPENPLQISRPDQLLAISANSVLLEKCFILVNDIIFDPNSNPAHQFTTAVIAPDTDTAGGYQGTPFTGCFDGSGYRIVNLYLANNSYLGLFGMIGSGGQVRNLELKNVMINGGGIYLGGLAGYTDQGTIKDCRLTINITGVTNIGGMIGYNTGGRISQCNIAGTIECINSSSSSAGGLIGYNTQTVIEDCFAAVDLEGEGIRSGGGLIGTNFESTIQYCSAIGNITGGVDTPNSGIGGLVGRCFGSTICFCSAFGDVTGLQSVGNLGGLVGSSSMSSSNSTIRFSRAAGHVTGGPYSTYIGGLVGQNYGQIEFCSASGDVTGSQYVGGLIGYNYPSFRITQCYAEGDVKGTDRVGGLLGTNYPLPSRACCYTAGRVSAGHQAKFVGGLVGQFRPISPVNPQYRCYFLAQEDLTDYYGLPLTDVQMKQQASFIEWDFAGETVNGTADIWRICEEGVSYPKHAWEYGMYGDYACPEGVGSEDLAAMTAAWGTHKGDPGFSYACDGSGDGIINMEDFAILSRHWLAPVLSVSQNRVEFFIPQSGPSQQMQTLTIRNTGRSSLNWDLELLEDPPGWLSISPISGTLDPNESQSLTLEADITGLPIGYYHYVFRIMSPSAQNSQQVVVTKLYVSPFACGSGTPEDPFRIRTPQQLIAIGEDPFLLDKCYKLIRDIDLSGFVFQDAVIAAMEGKSMGGYEGTPFSGLFDGNGYRIINLTINTGNDQADYLGLFGYIDRNGQVRNLGLENVLIDSKGSYIGALAGFNAGIRIDSCFATGIINGKIVGGLVGRNRSEILNCYTNISITGTGLGGLVGVNYSSEYYLDEYYSRNGTIKNSYTAGNWSGDHSRKVLAGYYEYDHAYELLCDLVTSCYFLDTMGSDTLPYTYPLTDAQMKQQASFVGWDFIGETANGTGDIWWIEEGVDYPHLWWELNEPPVADAGIDQIAYAGIDGFSQVQLDGNGSYDPDEEELEYYWYTDANDLIATGPQPVIILPIGEHIITLVVNDGHVDSEPNDVTLIVIGPLEVNLTLVPNVIRLTSRGDYITAILTLPKGVMIEDIDNSQPWRMLPGDSDAIFTRTISSHRWQTVFAIFDRQALLDVLDLPEPRGRSRRFSFRRHLSSTKIELTVYNKLITGQTIFGTKTIQIVSPPGTKTK